MNAREYLVHFVRRFGPNAGHAVAFPGVVREAEHEVRIELRDEILRLLTQDGATGDRRRSGYNQAIFHADGSAVWDRTELDMVVGKIDKAIRNLERK